MASVFYGTHRVPILSVTDLDSAIYIRKVDMRAALAELSAQIVSHKTVIIYTQPEVVTDPTGYRTGIDFGV